MADIVSHWIKPNETSRVPARWVFLDTEAHQHVEGGRNVQTWRLGITCFDHRNTTTQTWCQPEWAYHTAPAGLWQYVASLCRPGRRTIVVAHNMGYDARISNAFSILPTLGFDLERWQVGDRSCVIRWRRGKESLWLSDSVGWLPVTLEKVGGLIDLPKEHLPAFDGTDREWWRRCHRDVEILRTAFLDCIKWVQSDDLGNWQSTAGSMAWANWRHRHYTHRVLVHNDPDARSAERAAAWAGRCEAWRWGRLRGSDWTEWDLPLAYPRVAQDAALPTVLRSHVAHPAWKHVAARGDRARWLLRATVTTDTPTLPCSHDGRIVWPTGTFSGWWWDSEVSLALEHGATVKLIEGYRYAATPALASWATWIINAVESDHSGYTALQRLVLKGWARALIGRFGTRYKTWEPWGGTTEQGPEMGWLYDADADQVGRTLTIGGKQFAAMGETDGVESAPAVMSAIMAECRVRLWRILQAAGEKNVAYMDTDSIICNAAGTRRLRKWVANGEGWGVREKHTYTSVVVLGPRQLVLEGHHRISGVSRRAERTGATSWVGERWEGVEAAAAAGRLDQVVITPTVWKLEGFDPRREHLPGGRTIPLQL